MIDGERAHATGRLVLVDRIENAMQRIQYDPRWIADAAERFHLRHRAGIGVDAIKDNPLSGRRVAANVSQSLRRAALSESAFSGRCRGNGAGDSGTTDHQSTACDRDNVCHVRSSALGDSATLFHSTESRLPAKT